MCIIYIYQIHTNSECKCQNWNANREMMQFHSNIVMLLICRNRGINPNCSKKKTVSKVSQPHQLSVIEDSYRMSVNIHIIWEFNGIPTSPTQPSPSITIIYKKKSLTWRGPPTRTVTQIHFPSCRSEVAVGSWWNFTIPILSKKMQHQTPKKSIKLPKADAKSIKHIQTSSQNPGQIGAMAFHGFVVPIPKPWPWMRGKWAVRRAEPGTDARKTHGFTVSLGKWSTNAGFSTSFHIYVSLQEANSILVTLQYLSIDVGLNTIQQTSASSSSFLRWCLDGHMQNAYCCQGKIWGSTQKVCKMLWR